MKAIFSIRSILIIILIILFYNQILALGLRIYIAFVDNPAIELILADYYQSAGKYNTEFADRFYRDLLVKLEANASKTEGVEKFNAASTLGKLYECGYGTERNLSEAKSWYEDALDTAPSDQQKNILQQKLAAIEHQAVKPKEKKSEASESDHAGQAVEQVQQTPGLSAPPSGSSEPAAQSSQSPQSDQPLKTQETSTTESEVRTTQTKTQEQSTGNTSPTNLSTSRPPATEETPTENPSVEQRAESCYVSEKPRLIPSLWNYFQEKK